MTEPAADAAQADDVPVRSTQGVLLVLAAIVAIPIVALLVAFAPGGRGGGAGEAVLESVDTDRVQAVYLTNDLVYFGLVTEARGDFFVLTDAFFLRGTGGDEGDEDQEAGLVPVPVSQEVGGDGDLLVNAAEVLRIQTLTDDSEIAQAIDVEEG